MPQLNYVKALDQYDKLLNSWKKRNVTPFGKITVIKTFIMSKFNHIFSSIPSLPAHFFKTITKMPFDYIWDNNMVASEWSV